MNSLFKVMGELERIKRRFVARRDLNIHILHTQWSLYGKSAFQKLLLPWIQQKILNLNQLEILFFCRRESSFIDIIVEIL